MPTPLENWLREASPAQVIDRIEAAEARAAVCERYALCWHVVLTTSNSATELKEAVEKIADLLTKGGYVWPPHASGV